MRYEIFRDSGASALYLFMILEILFFFSGLRCMK